MAVTLDAISQPSSYAAPATSWAHTCNANLLVVFVAQYYTDGAPSGITCGGDAMALVDAATFGSNCRLSAYFIQTDLAGDKTIVVSGLTNTICVMHAVSFRHVDTSWPVDQDWGITMNAPPVATAVSEVTEHDIVLDCIATLGGTASFAPGPNQVELGDATQDGFAAAVSMASTGVETILQTPTSSFDDKYVWVCLYIYGDGVSDDSCISSSTVDNVYLEGMFPEDCLSNSFTREARTVSVSDAESSSAVDNIIVEASAGNCITVEGDFTLPEFELDATCLVPSQIDFEFTMPKVYLEATHYHNNFAAGEFTLPKLALSIAELNGGIHTSEFTLPAMSLSAQTATMYAGDFTLPALTLDAVGVHGSLNTGVFSLPSMSMEAQTGGICTGDFDMPSMSLAIIGYNQSITGEFILPVMSLVAYKAWVSAAVDTRTYNLNMLNMAMTTYDNYNFNSYCMFKGHAYGANEDGVYLLEGDTDEGMTIPWELKTGLHDFQIRQLKRIPDCYLSMKGEGTLQVYVTSDRAAESVYEIVTTNTRMQNNKVQIGRGHKGRYWEFKITGDGGMDFQLEEISLNVDVIGRKV